MNGKKCVFFPKETWKYCPLYCWPLKMLHKSLQLYFHLFHFHLHSCFPRSSHCRLSIKKAVPKTFAIFTGKHLCWSLFFGLQACSFIKKDNPTQTFSVNIAKFLRTPILKNIFLMEVKNFRFSENFVLALNEWTLIQK